MTPPSLPPSPQNRFEFLKRLSDSLPMGPRKKSKLNNKAPASDADNSSLPGEATTETQEPRVEPQPQTPSATSTPNITPANTQTPLQSHNSWYGGGWRSKASPLVAKLARENVGVSGGSTQELPSEDLKPVTSRPPPGLLSKRRPSKGSPIAASMTKVHATSNGEEEEQTDSPLREQDVSSAATKEPPLPPEPTTGTKQDESKSKTEKEQTSEANNYNRYSGVLMWKSWWSRPDGYDTVKSKPAEKTADQTFAEDAQKTPLPGTTPTDEPNGAPKELQLDGAAQQDTPGESKLDAGAKPTEEASAGNSQGAKSWFWLWSRTQNTPHEESESSKPLETVKPDNTPTGKAEVTKGAQPSVVTEQVPQPTSTIVDEQASQGQPAESSVPKATGWAFWSRQSPKTSNDTDSVHKEVGELAVADTPSQTKPEAAQFNERDDPKPKEAPKPKATSKGKDTLKKAATNTVSLPNDILPKKSSDSSSIKSVDTTKSKTPSHVLLPRFRTTYQFAQSPTVWQRIRQYLLGGEDGTPHLHLIPSPPRIKKALAIGVHGYFPSPLIRTMIGQPTGTSIRFANCAASAINDWTQSHGGYSCEIEKVALEGEGFIGDRVDTLWKLLLNWIEHIRNADFILIACHSQGVPVTIMLIAKLISFGCISPTARIGVCAMAGVNLGPFVEYKTRYFGSTAAELFEFSNPKSAVSVKYMEAVQEVLKFGVKLVYIGSIDDQLVSLESSTFANITHPYIYRAVFIDGKIHAPDFIAHLVGFTLKLRNLGLPDHGLIRELSPALAGSLYSGEGHSRLYEDPAVYSLAVQHALETTSLPHHVPVTIKDFEGTSSSINPNPYFLPWAMRGLLEEEFVRRELGQEVDELLKMFESWKPTSKALKDVRFRLEAVRSKL